MSKAPRQLRIEVVTDDTDRMRNLARQGDKLLSGPHLGSYYEQERGRLAARADRQRGRSYAEQGEDEQNHQWHIGYMIGWEMKS